MSDLRYSNRDNSAVSEFAKLVFHLYNAPDDRTGVSQIISFGRNILGTLPPPLIEYIISLQVIQFGGYTTTKDTAPSILFTVLFAIIGIVHLAIFLINWTRGHYFTLSLAWVLYCIFRVIGFGLRIPWSFDVTLLPIGLTSEVFSIAGSVVIVTFNLILAQRLFTWRHPVGGARKLFWGVMIGLYAFMLVWLILTVASAFIPYLNFLSTQSFLGWQGVVKFTSIILILYSLTSVSLLGLSYWSPTRKDENLYTYQPWWIESFSTFYFVEKNSAQIAEETFMKRNSQHRHAVRVIAATLHHHNMVEGLSNSRGDLSHNLSIFLLIYSTLAIFISQLLRALVVFDSDLAFVGNRAAMFICWGALEAIVNILYIVFRVDLRFYRPDRLPQKIREIITNLQSGQRTNVNNSDVEDEDDYYPRHEDPESFVEVGTDDDLYFDEITYDKSLKRDSFLTDSQSDEGRLAFHEKANFKSRLSDDFKF